MTSRGGNKSFKLYIILGLIATFPFWFWILYLLICLLCAIVVMPCIYYDEGVSRHISTSVEKSKKYGVFVKELNYEIVGKNIDSRIKIKPFIEQGYNLPFFNSDRFVHVIKKDFFPYQICIEHNFDVYKKDSNEHYFVNYTKYKCSSNSNLGEISESFIKSANLKDTFYFPIYSERGFEEICNVKLWDSFRK